MLAGAALAVVTVALPPAAVGSDAAVLAIGAVAGAAGTALLLTSRELSESTLGVVAALGTALITVATWEGGFDGTGTADNQMLYVWVCLYSFFFFSTRLAILQLALVGVAYALLLSSQDVAVGDVATRWAVTMTVLLTGGLIVARLRLANDQLLGQGMHGDAPGHAFVLVDRGRVLWYRDYWLAPTRSMYVDPRQLLADIPT